MANKSETKSGFTTPIEPQDQWTIEQYRKHGLPQNPTLKQVEPVATKLLKDSKGFIPAAELVLGRRVDARELTEGGGINCLSLAFSLPTEGKKFGGLLLVRTVEESARQKLTKK